MSNKSPPEWERTEPPQEKSTIIGSYYERKSKTIVELLHHI